MRVLITGSNGHVGSAIASHLTQIGWQVVGLGRQPGSATSCSSYVQADIGAPSLVERITSTTTPCEAIVHAAAALNKDLYAPAICLTNCLGTQQILDLASIWDVHSLVYISSVPVIGMPRQLPITEIHPVDPPTAYHASKLFGEYLTILAGRTGLTGAILRLTSPVGPGMKDNRILPVFVKQALANLPLQLSGQGKRQQNYVDVRDVAAAVASSLNRRAQGVFNVAGSRAISNLELAQVCIQTLGSSSDVQFTGKPDAEESIRWDVSIAKATEHLGYVPQFGIEQSIRAMGSDYATGIH